MLLQELKAQVFRLSIADRLRLVTLIVQSLQGELTAPAGTGQSVVPVMADVPEGLGPNHRLQARRVLIHRMRGFLKTDRSAPTDVEVKAMLAARRMEQYGP